MARFLFLFFLADINETTTRAVLLLGIFFLAVFGISVSRFIGIPSPFGFDAFVDLDEREHKNRHYYECYQRFHSSFVIRHS